MFSFFIKGIIAGFCIAAPVGPIGVLCIRRTLANGKRAGIASGLGAAVADGFYGAVAAYGLTMISSFLLAYQLWLRVIGSIFLAYLGIKTLYAQPPRKIAGNMQENLVGDFVSTLFLTLANPMTIIAFIALFSGLGLGVLHSNFARATSMVIGLFLGSLLWWFVLAMLVGILRSRVTTRTLRVINILSGLIIIAFAGFILMHVLFELRMWCF